MIAVVLVAICLVPTGAHLLEMPRKMAMGKDAYFTVQPIYNGWALFGVAEAAAIAATAVLAWTSRDRPLAMGFALAGASLIGASLVAFFSLTYPANVATSNWTVAHDNWEALRRNWELGHAIEAALTFLSLVAVTASAVARDS